MASSRSQPSSICSTRVQLWRGYGCCMDKQTLVQNAYLELFGIGAILCLFQLRADMGQCRPLPSDPVLQIQSPDVMRCCALRKHGLVQVSFTDDITSNDQRPLQRVRVMYAGL